MSEKRDYSRARFIYDETYTFSSCELTCPGEPSVKSLYAREIYEFLDRTKNAEAEKTSLREDNATLEHLLHDCEAGAREHITQMEILEAENDRLREDLQFLQVEYGDSDESMTGDALALKERCNVLAERDRLREELKQAMATLELGQINCDDIFNNLKQAASVANAKRIKAEAELAAAKGRYGKLKQIIIDLHWPEACQVARKALEVSDDD